jgi:hypothetical protein
LFIVLADPQIQVGEEESVRLEDPDPHTQQVAPALYNVLGLRLQGGCHTRGN